MPFAPIELGLRMARFLQTGTPLGNERFRAEIERAFKVRVGQSRRGRPRKHDKETN